MTSAVTDRRAASVGPARPALSLRVGITGARKLDAAQLPRLASQVREILDLVRRQMARLANTDAGVVACYDAAPGVALQPILRFLSPLARGADRLAAREALALGYQLHVPMPFPIAEYEKDFDSPEDLAEFRELFARAGEDWVAIDGDHGPEMNRAYEAVGHYVARHSDILIAIWNGGPSAGRGGTADIVRHATATGVPVCWLHTDEDRPPAWLADIDDLREPGSEPSATAWDAALTECLNTVIPPPSPVHPHHRSLIARIAGLGRRGAARPQLDYFAADARPRRWFWQAYAGLMRWASGLALPWTPPRRPQDRIASFWFDRYAAADERAGAFAARYRSTYVWVFALSAVAIGAGVLALVFSLWHPTAWLPLLFALVELSALVTILALICVAIRRDWHELSIEYRLLAELNRKQQALAPLGWTLPIVAVRTMVRPDRGTSDRAGWVAWLFAAEQRAAPLPRGALAEASYAATLVDLIDEQQTYHTDRWKLAEAAGHTLERCGVILFIAVLGCVVLKLLAADVFDLPDLALLCAVLASVLPGVSAAFLGIRGYAELQVLADQSRRLADELAQARARVARLDPRRPLASQDFGAETARVATLMLQDIEGWARLFRVKTMEPA